MQTILIVDDEATLRNTLGDKLKSEGFTVLVAANGEEALNQVAHQQVDLILLDLMMPGMHGTMVINKLKDMGKGNIPVIVLTNVETGAVQDNITEYLIKSDMSLDGIADAVRKRLGIPSA